MDKRLTVLLLLIFAISGCTINAKETACPEPIPIPLEIIDSKCDTYTKCLVDIANNDLKWKSYLWNEDYYSYYPTGCKNPKKTFTMCKDGCDIKYYCDTNSMNPLFYCNARLTLAECTIYTVGDIILVNNKEKLYPKYDYYIHQIVRINGNQIITKGFNNNGIDGFNSTIFDIKGKVVKIEYD